MKPIRLELAGLQSYRERQTVDFESLCRGGVFGIFGPTGSGKSTILDAMTLALYGKVERAPKGTQAIMNSAEDRLAVAFTFELAGPDGRVRYRVERQYRRAGDTSVHISLCRLVELAPEGERVLADRQSDVDAAVEKLIGLNMQDFTRAVVLPQGKFAEFLTLTGKERRQMLQRLFGLERYGDALAARLAARHDEVRLALRETEAEQLGLGEASPEAVAAAGERLEAARREAERLKDELAGAEREHERLARRRERDEERRRLERELDEIAEQEPAIREKERLAARLEQAAQVAPALRDADEASAEAALREREALATEAEWRQRQEEAARANESLERARAEAARGEADWLVKRERAEQARAWETERAEWDRKARDLASDMREAETRLGRLETALAAERDQLEREQARHAEWRAGLEALLPLADASERRQEAALRKRQVEDARGLAEEAEKEHADAAEKERQNAARRQEAARRLAERTAEGRMLAEEWRRAQDDLARWQHRMRRAAEEAQQALAVRERNRAVRTLAAALIDGEPCPVCGSTHHPHPAAAVPEADGADDDWAARLRTAERIGREAAGWTDRAEWQRQRLDERIRELVRTAAEAGAEPGRTEAATGTEAAAGTEAGGLAGRAGETAAREAAAAAETGAAPVAAETSAADVTEDGADPAAAEAAWQAFTDRLQRLAAAGDCWHAEASAALREAVQAADAALLLAERRAETARKRDRARQQAARLREAWEREFAGFDYETAEAGAEAAREAAATARQLRERLDKGASRLAETESRVRAAERERNELLLRLTELRTQWEAAVQHRDSLAERLREITGGASAAEWLRQAEAEREHLGRVLVEAQERHALAERQWKEAETALAAARERLAAAVRLRERAAERLARAMAEHGFADEGELRPLLARAAEVRTLREDIRRFREREAALRSRLDAIRAQGPDEPVGDEVWQASLDRLDELRRGYEAALAEAARAERDLEDLSARRERWEQLEERRTKLAADLSRIVRLQSVLRGNAFVEFMAEEQLVQVCRTASERLGFLTRRRYALEVDAGGGFVIRDDANGGLRRPVSSLSGGETFLASLALALALSAQIQLRGRYPLEFFFLDEGFGTLDAELLDLVVTSLERLHSERLAVGVISHVPELQARLPRRLVVTPAEPGGRGSRITYETL